MIASAHDRSGGKAWEASHGMVLPEVDPTDGLGAAVQHVSQPERRLLFAVLSDAIVRYRRLATAPRHASIELREAERWIRSDDREWPCSFVNVCEALDIAWEPLRRAVLAWRRGSDSPVRVTRRGLLVKESRRRSAGAVPVCEVAGAAAAPAAVASAASAG